MQGAGAGLWSVARKKQKPSVLHPQGTDCCQRPCEWGAHPSPGEHPGEKPALVKTLTAALGASEQRMQLSHAWTPDRELSSDNKCLSV